MRPRDEPRGLLEPLYTWGSEAIVHVQKQHRLLEAHETDLLGSNVQLQSMHVSMRLRAVQPVLLPNSVLMPQKRAYTMAGHSLVLGIH